jgi:hypothetical protein
MPFTGVPTGAAVEGDRPKAASSVVGVVVGPVPAQLDARRDRLAASKKKIVEYFKLCLFSSTGSPIEYAMLVGSFGAGGEKPPAPNPG